MNLPRHPISVSLWIVPIVAFQQLPTHHLFTRMMKSASSMSSDGLTDIGSEKKYPEDRNIASSRLDDDNDNKNDNDNDNNDTWMNWRNQIDISIGRSRKIRGSNYVQLSTISDGEPRCRTVVFRGFQNLPIDHPCSVPYPHNNDWNHDDIGPKSSLSSSSSCVMKMITDSRSKKVSEVSKCTRTELVWWFPKSSEQYRVRGHLCFVGGGQFQYDEDPHLSSARKEQWGNLSDAAREQFFWQQPGIPYTSGESADVPLGGRNSEGKLLPPPHTFLLMILRPYYVDYLRLGDNFRQLDELVEGQWQQRRVNP
jgi:pyridoxamine 5'-phosphate oxidase